MNDRITISTAQLFAMFPDQDSARVYLESRLWLGWERAAVWRESARNGSMRAVIHGRSPYARWLAA